MKQIRLAPELLQRGLDDAPVPTPDTPAAIVRATPEELAERYKLLFQHTYDDLGDLSFAVIDANNGLTFSLERHRDEPGTGTTISLFMRDVVAQRLDDVLRELELSRDDLSWEIPDDGVSELRQLMARHLEQRSYALKGSTQRTSKVPDYVFPLGAGLVGLALVAASLTWDASAVAKLNAVALLFALVITGFLLTRTR